ncbi:hypothetical protein L0128_16765 [candidate division KSB1 bacterium]|nr:hypothetical protein [candidate division KSB1 bacterium]
MKRNGYIFIIVVGVIIGICTILNAQYGKKYEGPDDPAADKEAERTGFMNGNNVYLFFRNTTELSDCCNLGYWVSRWPADYSGSKMHDGISLMIGARVYIENDSIPVTDLAQIQSRTDLDTLYYCQSSFREFMDKDPAGNVEWAFYPVFGYFNEANPHPAMSNKPDSWPPEGWPARGDEKKWPGVWNGRFGLGIMKADLETYFVVNDAQDQEYLEKTDTTKYYPRPGVKIGDKRPQVTIQRGFPWGGIGIRVETRGFQWKNPEAADCIFWEYTIANISDYDLPEMYFGYQVDNAVGGEEYDPADDVAYYDTKLEMCYSWDLDGEMIGGGGVPGCMGIAFLESPGIAVDAKDNDEDGLTDERRDNEATQIVGPNSGITNRNLFVEYYGKDDDNDGIKTFTFRDHWDADEDQDWRDGNDVNQNGVYDFGEYPGDDVGTDGSGPFDLDYPGPDANGTECNHRPDLLEGVGSEPNFGFTDISESDMLGLTAFKYLLHWFGGAGGPRTASDDESTWFWLTAEKPLFHDFQPNPQNFIEQFASGTFTLYKGRTERISMAELHALEALHEQEEPPFDAPALFKLKQIVQFIYETDYQFAQPPLMPTLTASPGDGKVILSWDNIAEKYTREPLLAQANDFEGYKLFKSTDPFISDNKIITDGFGTPKLVKPVFECDLVDGKKGFTDFGLVNGAGYYLGNDKGITNYYIDTDVENGRTYYYVLVAYDYGIQRGDVEVGPSFNTYTLNISRDELVEEVSKNVAIVIPHQYAAGYLPPNISELDYHQAFGKNTLQPEVIVPPFIKEGHRYKVMFGAQIIGNVANISHGGAYKNNSIRIYDVTQGDSLIYEENPKDFTGDNFEYYRIEIGQVVEQGYRFRVNEELRTAEFDGMILRFQVPILEPTLDLVNSGWITGRSAIRITQPVAPENRLFPYDYNLVFTDNPNAYTGRTTAATMKDENFLRMDKTELLLQQAFSFYVETPNVKDSTGANLKAELIGHDVNRNGQFDWLQDRVLVGFLTDQGRRQGLWAGLGFVMDFQNVASEGELPKPGDIYHITFNRGFWLTDSVTFKVQVNRNLDLQALKESMDQIKVVPNPYVVSNVMEPAIGNWQRNQPRRLMFTHLPAQCTIKIFTISGLLVHEITVNNSVANRGRDWDTNSDANGTAFWDLRSKEGLDIAAGYYIYHVKSIVTGDEKVGKLAIIK